MGRERKRKRNWWEKLYKDSGERKCRKEVKWESGLKVEWEIRERYNSMEEKRSAKMEGESRVRK